MTNDHFSHGSGAYSDFILILLFSVVLLLYLYAAVISSRTYKQWPFSRYTYWLIGLLCIALSVVGPIANLSHINFTAHMIGHLLLGMLAPLFIALAAPVTLILRTLPLQSARRISRILRGMPFRMLSDPLVASILNIGGLCILYTTNLYSNMHKFSILHIIVHLHIFTAGYLFTISMIYIDRPPHRTSYVYRGIIFIFTIAAHGILSKTIYVNPPLGISATQAETGAKLMYYGGDAIDTFIIIIFFYQWLKIRHPRNSLVPET
ncbi:cytochrome c oxidase assembly protein [Paenibacillus sp. MAH-36]|uniref:Cytochrome c oxidase assembly protein n=1 Tax=Paenibacillus violae TaxID=3077234 RepID=A0ABU3RGA1_9BACL|nr:cytochrome c oxidase assembly protein [Paenibacillus sp. PFR10]MDU0203312.1 cytochrome c oxidase assembly protein [Paenibacillus sp. PFR10]